jgi:hypothetical protein
MRRCRLLFPLVLLVLTSCSGSSKPGAAVAAAPTTVVVPSTAAVPLTTTVVAVTVPPSTTSTTVAKTLELVVAEAAAQNWMGDREGCYLTIETCDPTTFTPEGSAQREGVNKVVVDFRAANFKMRTNLDDPSYIVVKRVVVGSDRTTAEVKACYWSTGIVYEPNEKAAGGEIISNDKKASYDVVMQMLLVGKRWLIAENTRSTTYEGFNTCPAR